MGAAKRTSEEIPLDIDVEVDSPVPAPRPQSAPRRTLGRYELCHEIASGGMATVYLAVARGASGFGKALALKQIHPHLARERSFVEMFLDEARIASRIQHPNVASDLINLGAIQQEWGQWNEAEQYYRKALAIYRGYYGENHFETAATLNMVGRTLVQQDSLRAGGELLHQALAIRERIYGPDHPLVASTLNELGLLAQNEGRLDEARRNFERMIAILSARRIVASSGRLP